MRGLREVKDASKVCMIHDMRVPVCNSPLHMRGIIRVKICAYPPERPFRFSKSKTQLLLDVWGQQPETRRAKLGRVIRVLQNISDFQLVRQRLQMMADHGVTPEPPPLPKIYAGGLIMLFGVIIPDNRLYCASVGIKGLNFYFHLLLRFIQEPASLMDPIGLFLPDLFVLAHHLLQDTHREIRYDLELTRMFGPQYLTWLRIYLETIIHGKHVERDMYLACYQDADYPEKLLEHIDAYIADGEAAPLWPRQGTRSYINSRGEDMGERTRTIPELFKWCGSLPDSRWALLRYTLGEIRFMRRANQNPAIRI